MTYPRQYLPGATYAISRRCALRQFRMVPSPQVNRIMGFCIAEAASHHNVAIHDVMVMSNHIHMVVTDRDASLPEFLRRAHRHIALCMKAEFDWSENFWSTEKPSVVALEDAATVLRKMVYLRVNPVAAGSVKHAAKWPGFHTVKLAVGKSLTLRRPDGYFRKDGPLPETATLTMDKPPAFADRSDEDVTAMLGEALREAEAEVRSAIHAEGREFLGRRRCRQFSRSYCPEPEEKQISPSPTFATLNRDLYQAALERRRAFVAEYRAAYERWRAGEHDVEFPPGTYWLRVYAGARCRVPT